MAAVLAGGALAATGQLALDRTLPAAADGVDVLATGVHEMLADAPAPTAPAASAQTLAPVVPGTALAAPTAEPRTVDVDGLVKAAERHRRAAAEAARADAAEAEARAARAQAAKVRAAEAAAADAAKAEAAARTAAARAADRGPAVPRPRAGDAADRARTADRAPAGAAVQMISGRVTSGFGARWGRAHRGLDVAAPIGTPIRAPLAGEVVAAGPASGFGLWVRLRHADGTVTTYGHVNRALVQVGARVAAGQEIAEVGNRGQSTGPHLHVEVQTPAGTTVNPRPWLDDHRIGY
ncbi:MAG TPA: M23 family metallopeptidase [Pseudonocardia sp.]